MLALATITAGAVNGSTSVSVSCDMPNGTAILIYRGTFWIGQGVLAAGVATISVLALAKGDTIQASVTERGNFCGPPVTVIASQTIPTGWRIPETVLVDGVEITAEEYETLYGEKPAATYDPALRLSTIVTDIDPTPAGAATDATILFDVRIEQSVGSTVVTIQNVVNQQGNPLIRWAAGESFGNVLSRSFTANATITIDVKGEDNTTPVSRTVSVTVFSPPTTTPTSSDIVGFSWRVISTSFVRVFISSLKGCQCRLEGFDMTWQSCVFYGIDPGYQEAGFYPVPPGSYTIWVRVAGDTNADHWKSIAIVVS